MKIAGLLIVALGLGLAAPVLADGDPAKGKKVFRKCKACHTVGEKAKNKIGPILNGVIEREIASVEGFKYSKPALAMKEEGFVWTVEALDAYLTKPKNVIKGGKMSFIGLRKPKDRENVIAYLRTFE